MKKIGLVVKYDKRALKKADEFEDWLLSQGCSVVRKNNNPLDFNFLGKSTDKGDDGVQAEKDLFCVFVLGGDGTFLSAARWLKDLPIPLLGVKFGEVGFLAEIVGGKLFSVAKKILDNNFTTNTKTRLQVGVYRENETITKVQVLNDIVINKGALARLAHIDTFINDQAVTTYKSDGLIVATPTGSTAYSLAAGGPVIHPEVSGIIITPICPFTLTNRPIIVPDSSQVKIKISPKSSDIMLTFDGQEGLEISSQDTIIVEKSPYPIKTVTIPGQNYYDVLKTKLKWSGSRI